MNLLCGARTKQEVQIMSKNKLKPCPFCGSKNLMQYGMKAAGHRNNDTAGNSGVNGGGKMK